MSAIVEPNSPYGRDGYVAAARVGSVSGASRSAVSWGAIFAGGAAAAALSLILLLLGTGLGLSSVSPWSNEGIDADTLGWSSILWITFMQLAASAMGGYLAGRLRTKWADLHTDEVYFRDTAHGLFGMGRGHARDGRAADFRHRVDLRRWPASRCNGGRWCRNGGRQRRHGRGGARGSGDAGEADGPMAYYIDSLFRADADSRGRVIGGANRCVARRGRRASSSTAYARASLPNDDVEYVGKVVAARTDLTQQQAEQRVRAVFTELQTTLNEAEAAARKRPMPHARHLRTRHCGCSSHCCAVRLSRVGLPPSAADSATFDVITIKGEAHAFYIATGTRRADADRHLDRAADLASRA